MRVTTLVRPALSLSVTVTRAASPRRVLITRNFAFATRILTRVVRLAGIENLAEPSFCNCFAEPVTGRSVWSATLPRQRTVPSHLSAIVAIPAREIETVRRVISTGGRSLVRVKGPGGGVVVDPIAGAGNETGTVTVVEPLRLAELTVSVAEWLPGVEKACCAVGPLAEPPSSNDQV